MAALLRILLLDPLAWIAACIIAGAAITVGLYGLDTLRFGLEVRPDLLFLASMSGIGIIVAIGTFSFVPSLIAILLAEVFGFRSVFYWLAVGGGIGFAAYALTGFLGADTYAEYRLTSLLGAGFLGGLAYWFIAGRLSGLGFGGAPPPIREDG